MVTVKCNTTRKCICSHKHEHEKNFCCVCAGGECVPVKVLHLTLHRLWFDEIAAGRKHYEYRLKTPYWKARLESKDFEEVWFRNGYGKNSPFMRVVYTNLIEDDPEYYIIILGSILEVKR